MLVIGDSHAGFWTGPLQADAEANGWAVTSVHDNGCPWPRMDSTGDLGVVMKCDEQLRDQAVTTAKELRPDIILLVSHSVVMRPVSTPSGLLEPGDAGWLEEVSSGSQRFIDELNPYTKRVVIMDVIPQTESPMVDCLSTGAEPSRCDAPTYVPPGTGELNAEWERIAATRRHVSVVKLDDLICPNGLCPSEIAGVLTFRDENHLTEEFASILVDQLVARINVAKPLIPRSPLPTV